MTGEKLSEIAEEANEKIKNNKAANIKKYNDYLNDTLNYYYVNLCRFNEK